MESILKSLENYFENTTEYKLNKDWEELKNLNEIGGDVFDILNVNETA